jgi:hypothetical protein
MLDTESATRFSVGKAILFGGLAAGVLDAADAMVAFKLVLGFDPIPIYQFVASGMLGPSAFQGGYATALLGLAIHFLIAFSAATVFVLAAARIERLRSAFAPAGLAFGVAVWAFMNLLVIPLSKIPPSPFSLPLFLNGVVGHALLVGLPIAYFTHRLAPSSRTGNRAVHAAA